MDPVDTNFSLLSSLLGPDGSFRSPDMSFRPDFPIDNRSVFQKLHLPNPSTMFHQFDPAQGSSSNQFRPDPFRHNGAGLDNNGTGNMVFNYPPAINHQQFSQLVNFHNPGSEASAYSSVSSIGTHISSGDNALEKKRRRYKTVLEVKRTGRGFKHTTIIKGQWTPEEDQLLVRLVERFGVKKWAQIAQWMPGRLGKQCRERWNNHLMPDIKKDEWSEEEDAILIEWHKRIGNHWAEIAKRLSGRTENNIKNRWNATKRKQKAKRVRRTNNSHKSMLLQTYINTVTATPQAQAQAQSQAQPPAPPPPASRRPKAPAVGPPGPMDPTPPYPYVGLLQDHTATSDLAGYHDVSGARFVGSNDYNMTSGGSMVTSDRDQGSCWGGSFVSMLAAAPSCGSTSRYDALDFDFVGSSASPPSVEMDLMEMIAQRGLNDLTIN